MILLLLLAKLWGGSQASNDDYQLQVQPVVWAQEGLCMFVSCNFKYPSASWKYSTTYVYWYRVLENQYYSRENNIVATNDWNKKVSPNSQGRFKLVGKPEDGNCSLLISDVWKSDQGIYCFRVEHGPSVQYSYVESTVSLEVTDRTQPDVYILEPLWPNRWGTVICVFNATFEGCPSPSFTWMGQVLSTSQSQVSTHQSSVLKIAPQPQDQGTDLTCRVRFSPQGVIVQKTMRLDVAYAPKDLVIHMYQDKEAVSLSHVGASPSFHFQAQKGSFVQLLCKASSHPPASLSWSLGDRVLSRSNLQDPQELTLELPSVLAGDSGSYTCRAENAMGQEMRVVQLEVLHPPEDMSVTVSVENRTVLQTLQKANTLGVLQGQSLQLRCVANSSPAATLSWTRGSLLLNPAHPTEPGLLLLPQIQPDQEGEFTCQAHNKLGSQQVSVTIRVYYEKGTLRGAFSNGVLVGTGVAGLLCLTVILILVIILRRRGKQTKQLSRGSTIMDYINIFAHSGSQAPNQEAEPHAPSQLPPPASSPQPKKNPKKKQKPQEKHCAGSHAEATLPPQANQDQEVQYSHLYFPGRRPQVLQAPNDSHEEYVEIRFH